MQSATVACGRSGNELAAACGSAAASGASCDETTAGAELCVCTTQPRAKPRTTPRMVRNRHRPLLATSCTFTATSGATAVTVAFRGMRNMELPAAFLAEGGTEYAPMSTTTDLNVAVRYALSRRSVLFRLRAPSFMQAGADLGFVSAFPAEAEML